MLLFNFWLLAILVISHPGSQSTASNYNHEARDYVEVTGLAAGAIYNKPPQGQPRYQNITANLVVPSVSPPAGAVPNQVYGAYFWVALGTAPVLQAGVIATTVTDGSHSTTNYSAAWSWFEGQYQTGDPSSEVVDLGINPSSIVRIEVGIEFLGIMNGSQGHIKMDNIDGAGDTLERKLRTDDQSLEKTTETAWWYVIAPVSKIVVCRAILLGLTDSVELECKFLGTGQFFECSVANGICI